MGGVADFTLEGIWRQFVGSSALGKYEVKLDKATRKYEMARVDAPITGKGITNVQFDGKTWSFDSDWGSRIVKFTLTKVDNNTFEGIVDGSQKNKWVRQVPPQGAGTFTAAEQAAIDKFIAERGKDVKAKDELGVTLLHWAAYKNDVAVVRFLISQGANVNAECPVGSTPLHHAVFNPSVDVAK